MQFAQLPQKLAGYLYNPFLISPDLATCMILIYGSLYCEQSRVKSRPQPALVQLWVLSHVLLLRD